MAGPRPCRRMQLDDETTVPKQTPCGLSAAISQPSMSMMTQDGRRWRRSATSSSVVTGTLTHSVAASTGFGRPRRLIAVRCTRVEIRLARGLSDRQPQDFDAIVKAVQTHVLGQESGGERVWLEREHEAVGPHPCAKLQSIDADIRADVPDLRASHDVMTRNAATGRSYSPENQWRVPASTRTAKPLTVRGTPRPCVAMRRASSRIVRAARRGH